MTRAETYFAGTYAEARAKFHNAASDAGAHVTSHLHPLTGPDGDQLAVDSAWVGPEQAERVLMVVSGTHGVEGFCGSAAQVGWLRTGLHRELPAGIAVLCIHAINPHGFAWLSRVNEDNVDLNRNFVDHDRAYAVNQVYEELAQLLCPTRWDAETIAACQDTIEAYAEAHGQRQVAFAISQGQYNHPDGIFYGGRAPVWSHRVLADHVLRHLRHARAVALIDLHTGLGPNGYGEPIATKAQADARAVLQGWYGDELTAPDTGTAVAGPITGTVSNGVIEHAPQAVVYPITLEFGTRPRPEVRLALRADNWLRHHGNRDSAQGREIKAQIRDAFYPDHDDWKESVFDRWIEIARKAVSGLAGTDPG